MKHIILLIILASNLVCTSDKKSDVNSDLASVESVYNNCMETFKDDVKCKELSGKTKVAREREEAAKSPRKVELTPEQEKSLWIRDEMKNKFMSKSKLAVLETFGEPEARNLDTSGREHLIYKRPISRYSKDHDPDIEIRFLVLRNQVSQIFHTPPPTTPSGLELFKKIPK